VKTIGFLRCYYNELNYTLFLKGKYFTLNLSNGLEHPRKWTASSDMKTALASSDKFQIELPSKIFNTNRYLCKLLFKKSKTINSYNYGKTLLFIVGCCDDSLLANSTVNSLNTGCLSRTRQHDYYRPVDGLDKWCQNKSMDFSERTSSRRSHRTQYRKMDLKIWKRYSIIRRYGQSRWNEWKRIGCKHAVTGRIWVHPCFFLEKYTELKSEIHSMVLQSTARCVRWYSVVCQSVHHGVLGGTAWCVRQYSVVC